MDDKLSATSASLENGIDAQTLLEQGFAHHQNGNLAEAQACYAQAWKFSPNDFNALHLQGLIAYQTQQFVLAIDWLKQAVAVAPHEAVAWYNLGVTWVELKSYDQAIEAYSQAILLNPEYTTAYINRAVALTSLQRHQSALDDYARAIQLDANSTQAYFNAGVVLARCGQHQSALEYYSKAIAINPQYTEAYHNRGTVFQTLKQYQAAIQDYTQALSLTPQHAFLRGMLLQLRLQICDWDDFEQTAKRFAASISAGEKASAAFYVLAWHDDPALQHKAAQVYISSQHPSVTAPLARYTGHDKIRLGYFSADFRAHPVMALLAEVFERHDKRRFSLYAFSLAQHPMDDYQRRALAAFDHFFEVQTYSDEEIVRLARQHEIDIAVDLGGFTQDSRTGIFAHRLAPVQVNYLGYAGTMGAQYMDYLIADRTVIPPESQAHYSEQVVYLPQCFMPCDTTRLPLGSAGRADYGLPDDAFVFCSFNNAYKINPMVFDVWMRLLQAVPKSVLWLSAHNATATANLQEQAKSRGVAQERLIFAQYLPSMNAHLARHRLADLFLDTLPYNAHTTAMDALWAGLPVLTVAGNSFAGRVATSLLNTLGLSELIAINWGDYEQRALDLAQNHHKLQALKNKLTHAIRHTALFDMEKFTQQLETLYSAM